MESLRTPAERRQGWLHVINLSGIGDGPLGLRSPKRDRKRCHQDTEGGISHTPESDILFSRRTRESSWEDFHRKQNAFTLGVGGL
jgi:hypothetical protein